MFDLYNKIFGRIDDDEMEDLDDLDYLNEYDYEVDDGGANEATAPTYLNRMAAKPQYKANNNRHSSHNTRVIDMHSGNSNRSYEQEVIVMVPYDFEMTKVVCDHVKNGKTVICNIERIDDSTAQRVLDFILGATYALNGSLESISNKIFVVTPSSTRLSMRIDQESRNKQERYARPTYQGRSSRERVFPRYQEEFSEYGKQALVANQ